MIPMLSMGFHNRFQRQDDCAAAIFMAISDGCKRKTARKLLKTECMQ